MENSDRKPEILKILQSSTKPISASTLAKTFSVSRQSVVGDVALLRAKGHPIEATPRGYIYPKTTVGIQTIIRSQHAPEETRTELEILVKHGVHIIDVWVDHAVYSNIRGELNIKTNEDIERFLAKKTPLLLSLTEGIHFHTLSAQTQSDLDNALGELQKNGFITEVS